ncbi:cyclin family protein [Striga asiatica]|uniref:Cyclin family protein n=1 Tax=Striga asiatica TaxID=4170 RepID=A0A5A7PE51_STRAF|nr:cyclin family protein [Striga asiatica]
MEDSEYSCLLCKEDESSFIELCHYKDESYSSPDFVSECEYEYVEMLIQKETIFQSNSNCFPVKSELSWLKWARGIAVKWILDKRALFGLHFRTASLSLIYFDRFLSRRSIDKGKLWAVRLLSIACLSLAAKMEENRAPALSDYCVDEHNFEGKVIQRMELLVLNTLEWKMTSATPFAYLNYFITKFSGEDFTHEDVENRAVKLILAVIGEINLMEYRPSIIAASAALAACGYHLPEKLVGIKMNNAVSSWGSLEKEQANCCYNLLRDIQTPKLKASRFIISRSLISSTRTSSISDLENSVIKPTVGKRRKLSCVDDDHYCDKPKIFKTD